MSGTQDINIGKKSLQIKRFNINGMCPNPSIVMIAKRGSGKSWICRDILKTMKHVPGGVIISPTDEMSKFYGDFFPDLYIHYKYRSDILEKLMYRQKQMLEKEKEKKKEGKKIDPRAILVMDDCLASKGSWMKDELINTLFFNGRHYGITYILTMQFPLGISPELRNNFDYVFLLADDNVGNQKRLYEHYAGMFPTFDAFRQAFTRMTKDYGCMVICNRGVRNDIADKIFWYRASNTSIKSLGSKQFNELHKKKYDKDYKKKTKPLDLVDMFKKKKDDRVLKVDLVVE